MSQLISAYVEDLVKQGLGPASHANDYDRFRQWWIRYVGRFPLSRQRFQEQIQKILANQNV
ncbi:MAG: hypothetical protein K9J79_03680 [Desulfobacteraceae bacterium]|nr:hypothetical protein [Desulfobacteraceae bacterium]